MTHNQKMLEAALEYNQDGFKVLFAKDPTKKGGKAPIGRWHKFIKEDQTKEDVKTLWNYANTQDEALAVGVICDDTLEVIDIDSKYFLEHHSVYDIFDAIIDAVGEVVFEALIEAKTISGGYHLIYRSEGSTANQKLASRVTLEKERKDENDTRRVLIETRAEGGMVIVSPSVGYSFDSKQLSLVNAPQLSAEQRNAIIYALKQFDEVEETYKQTQVRVDRDIAVKGKSTIEEFNDSHTPIEFLEDAGWQFKYRRGKNTCYVRPGKSLSEGIGGGYSEKLELFRVFTSSTQFDADRSYNAFQVYAYLEHGGDYSAACKDLYHKGYGERMSKKNVTARQNIEVIAGGSDEAKEMQQDTDKMEEIFIKTRFDARVKPTVKPSTLFINCLASQKKIGIGGDGDMITFTGLQKSRKSAIASCAASCFLEGGIGTSLQFEAVRDGRNLIHLDTEQSDYERHGTCKEMLWQQNISLNKNPYNLHSFRLTDYTLKEKVQYIDFVIKRIGNVGLLFLDGIVDLCSDYNDQKESRALIEYMKRQASKYEFLLMSILHNARSTGQARGHLGTEILNKGRCTLNVKKDKDLGHSTLTVEDIRGAREPAPFDFTHNEDGHIVMDL